MISTLFKRFKDGTLKRLLESGGLSRKGKPSPQGSSSYLTVPIIAIGNHIMLPGAVQSIYAAEPYADKALRRLSREKSLVAISSSHENNPQNFEKGKVAVLSEILKLERRNASELAAEGRMRGIIVDYTPKHPFPMAIVKPLPDIWKGHTLPHDQAKQQLLQLLERWVFLKGNDELSLLEPVKLLSPERICDVFGFYALENDEEKRKVLELIDAEERFHEIHKILVREIDYMEKFPLISHFPMTSHSIH